MTTTPAVTAARQGPVEALAGVAPRAPAAWAAVAAKPAWAAKAVLVA